MVLAVFPSQSHTSWEADMSAVESVVLVIVSNLNKLLSNFQRETCDYPIHILTDVCKMLCRSPLFFLLVFPYVTSSTYVPKRFFSKAFFSRIRVVYDQDELDSFFWPLKESSFVTFSALQRLEICLVLPVKQKQDDHLFLV